MKTRKTKKKDYKTGLQHDESKEGKNMKEHHQKRYMNRLQV